MASFSYKVRDGSGELITGILAASTLDEASHLLRSEGKFIIKLAPAKKRDANQTRNTPPGKRKRIKRAEVITFTHQMAVMVDTGVPMSEALECITEQTLNENFKDVLHEVTDQIHAGNSLSSALGTHPKVFPPVMISLMQASEASGTMGTMLDRVSTYLGKELATAKKIGSSAESVGVWG